MATNSGPATSTVAHMSSDTSSERTLVTARAVATRLGIGPRAVLRFARQGTIPVVRIGRYVRFDAGAIESWLEAGGAALPGDWRASKGAEE